MTSAFQALMEAEVKASKESGLFHFDVRYTLPVYAVGTQPDYAVEVALFKEFLAAVDADKYMFQFERPTAGNLHIQAFIHVDVRRRTSTVLNRLMETYHERQQPAPMFHVAPCSASGKTALAKYVMKPETRVDGPYADHFIYMGQDLPPTAELYPYQLELVLEATKPPSKENRSINWLSDTQGNMGKSTICKYLRHYHQVPTIQFASAWNMMEVISANRHRPMYVFDLTRTKPVDVKMDDLYSIMEQLKTGNLQKTKGKVESWLQMPARVWVFSNYMPDTSKLTGDRWLIWNISEDKSLDCCSKRK